MKIHFPELPALLSLPSPTQPHWLVRSQDQSVRHQARIMWLLEKLYRTTAWSSKEDCIRQSSQGPEYYSPEGGTEKEHTRTNENAETHNPKDVNAEEPWDKTFMYGMTKYLRTNYRPKGWKLDRWRICSFCLNLQPSPGSEKTCNAFNHPKQMNFTPSYHVQFKVLRYSQADIYTETVFSSLYLSPNIYPVSVQLSVYRHNQGWRLFGGFISFWKHSIVSEWM